MNLHIINNRVCKEFNYTVPHILQRFYVRRVNPRIVALFINTLTMCECVNELFDTLLEFLDQLCVRPGGLLSIAGLTVGSIITVTDPPPS